MWEAPLSEELAKLWPLLLPFFRRQIHQKNAIRIALTLGLGFGLGEIWFVGYWVARHDPATANLPWYHLSGFIGERLMVCLMHGAFTTAVLRWWKHGLGWGILSGIGLHFLGNFPIFFKWINPGRFGRPNLGCDYLQLAGSLFNRDGPLDRLFLLWKLEPGRFFFGEAHCPGCQVVYARPFL